MGREGVNLQLQCTCQSPEILVESGSGGISVMLQLLLQDVLPQLNVLKGHLLSL